MSRAVTLTALAGVLVLLALAVAMVYWGFVADLNIELVTVGLVTAFLAAWLALRGLIAGSRGRRRAIQGVARFVVGAVSLCVLAVGMVIVLGIGESRTRSTDSPSETAPAPAGTLTLRIFPTDGAVDVPPDVEFIFEISGGRFSEFQPSIYLEVPKRNWGTFGLPCESTDDGGRVLCRSNQPLLFDTTYEATANFATRAADGKVKHIDKTWSFSTASKNSNMRGISSELIRFERLSDAEVLVEAQAGALHARGMSEGWRVTARNTGSFRKELVVADDGGFRGVVQQPRGQLSGGWSGVFLEVTNAERETVARLPWGPLVSDGGRTIYLSKGLPFRHLTPDGVLVIFDGDASADIVGQVSIEKAADSCSDRLPIKLDCIGSWKIDYHHPGFGRRSSTFGVSEKDKMKVRVAPPAPAVDVLYPAPAELSEFLLFFDSSLTFSEVSNWHSRGFLLRGIGRLRDTPEGRFISFRERFPVVDGGELDEVEPTAIYNQDLTGVHHLLVGRFDELAVVVGEYSGNNDSANWKVKSFDRCLAQGSALNLAAPLPLYAAAAFTGENRTLAILPVIADRPIVLTSADLTTGWIDSRVYLDSVTIYAGAFQFVGDLDLINADQQ